MNIDFNNLWVQGIVISVSAALIYALLQFLLNQVKKSGSSITTVISKNWNQRTGLQIYRQTLEKETFQVSHPWMKEDQTLSDILVDVNFEMGTETDKVELSKFVQEKIRDKNFPRILILGKPGSGKSIALRLVAKIAWDLPNGGLVPIILTFSDIKGVTTHDELKKKIIQKLEFYQFEKANNQKITADEFVEANLFNGKIMLLFDGYDELDKSNRDSAKQLLKSFLGTHRNISTIISSRDAVYERELAFEDLLSHKVNMAPFSPFSILKFLSQWKFEGSKSAQDLFRMINGRAHLSELASNPLMLTIIAFLYSLPKYTLPDNRVQFYEQCTRALLEEWDRVKDVSRANKFESHQKIAVLSRIAFEHISNPKETDEFIPEEKIYFAVRAEMTRLGLKEAEYSTLTSEVVQNSGLLQFISPDDYRFPHRTFMEFFAANYINKQKDVKELLNLYKQDSERWKQTLILYLGLNENKDSANEVLIYLKDRFTESWSDKLPHQVVFDALTECAVPDPNIANEILILAESYFNEKKSLPI